MLDFNQLSGYKKASFIFQFIQVPLGLLGIVGNILIFSVFCRRTLRKYSYSFYSRVKAVSDIVLLMNGFRHWAQLVFDANLDIEAPFFCAFDEFHAYVAGGISMWILMFISFDRYVTIVYPNRWKFFKQRWFQIILILVAFVVNAALCILLPINYQIVKIPVGPFRTLQMCLLPLEISFINSWLLLVNMLLVAFIINNYLNMRMFIFITNSRKKVSNNVGHTSLRGTTSNTAYRDRKFARASIGLGLSCFFMKLPLAVGLLVVNYVQMDFELIQLIFTITVTLTFVDNGISYVINMTLNSIFYEEFLVMIGVRKIRSILTTTQSGLKSVKRRMTLRESSYQANRQH